MFLFSFPVQARATVASIITLSLLCVASPTLQAADNQKVWSFNSTVTTAQKNDPWLTGNKHQQQAVEALSNAASSLPDPKMSVAFANLPTDGFDFAQEGMTQLKVGITQMFPRGDSLTIKNQQLRIQSEAYPFQRSDREAKVAVTVGSLWLDAYYVQQSIILIEQNRSLFEQLADVAQASYSSTLGKTRQQDIVRAQLELTQLDNRLDILAQQQNAYIGMLSQWLSTAFLNDPTQVNIAELGQLQHMKLAKQLPQLDLLHTSLSHASAARSNVDSTALSSKGLSNTGMNNNAWLSVEELTEQFVKHPAVMALDKKILATKDRKSVV